MFLGAIDKAYVLDKEENNPATVNGMDGVHPAWAVEYDINANNCEWASTANYTPLSLSSVRPSRPPPPPPGSVSRPERRC